LSKNNWYRGKARNDWSETGIGHDGRKGKTMKAENKKVIKCSTVFFVPNTNGGLLARKLREREIIMKDMMGLESSLWRLEEHNLRIPSVWTWKKGNTVAGTLPHAQPMGRKAETAGQETYNMSQSADGVIQKMPEGRRLQARGMESTMGRAVEAIQQ
jgi:hypothetical protein